VRRSRLLAQSGVPALLFCALLAVVAYNSGAGEAPGASGQGSTNVTQDAAAAARAELAELEAWIRSDAGGDAVELYARARALRSSRVPEVAAGAAALCEETLGRLDPALREVLAAGQALEQDGRDWEADQLYMAWMSRTDVTPEVVRVVRDARSQASGRLQRRFTEDMARLRALLSTGARAEAEELVVAITRYGGPDCERGARAALDGVAPVLSTATTTTTDAAARSVDATTLARALRGAVSAVPEDEARQDGLGDGAVRLVYRFDGPDGARELDDWPRATQSVSGPLLPSSLEGLEPTAHPGWYVADGVLVGEGWTRRQLAVDFRPDRPLRVELTARGARNRVAALGLLPGRCFLGGSGYALDLPLERVPRRTTGLEALVARCREREPVLALLEEGRFLELDELVARAEPPRTDARVSLELRPDPDGGGRHLLALRVGDVRLEPLPVTLDVGPLRAFLVALGPPVVWDEVVVTGTPAGLPPR
jgi:hypothetical protein